ncbi:MAG: L-sorbosone dehydrogenase, partial [Deltaproteobacteria bacterium]|nr:L-sorbosone dehydrogenase [Deltaproteobacteria bacterium]
MSVLLLVSASCSTETPSGVCDTGKCDQAGEIKLDASFQAFRYAERLDAPTAMAFGRDHRLYVALQGGDIVSLGDLDGDGKAEDRRAVASGFDTPSGLAFRPGTDDLYVGRKGGVDKIVGGAKSVVVDGFPNGEHSTDDVEFGPDGKLYISNGSVDDHNETNSNAMTQAAILRVDADGQNLMRFASGTRNPYGLAFDSAGRLWASDNGGDVPEGQPDELNLIEEGKDYGWPGCFGTDTAGACATKTPARANLEVHSSQDGLTVYEHIAFPSHFRGGIFVVSWGGAVPGFEGAGHKLTFVADPAGA